MHDEHLTEQEIIRRQKAEELRKKGIDPFGSAFKRTHHTNDIINEYDKFSREELEEKKIPVIIAGRIVLKRGQGKAGFMHIQDRDNKLQVYVRKDEVDEEEFDLFSHADLGDIVRSEERRVGKECRCLVRSYRY